MYIKVTKRMVNELNKTAKKEHRNMIFDYRETDIDSYRLHVCVDYLQSYDYGDFDFTKNKFKYIAVVYPPECYAMGQFLTTYDLCKEFKRGSFNTITDFTRHICDAMEI